MKAKLKKFNADYYEATSGHFVLSIAFTPDGSLLLSYTGKNRANGICTLDDGQGGGGGCPADVSEADRYKYPACN